MCVPSRVPAASGVLWIEDLSQFNIVFAPCHCASDPDDGFHGLTEDLAAAGNAILLISSELPEVLNLWSRILVFRDGRIVAEFARGAATQGALTRAMAGLTAN